MFQLVREDVHGQRRHADIHLIAVWTLLRLVAVHAAVRLLVP